MPNFNFDKDTQAYFDSLPKNVQQTIIMSDVQIGSVEQLKSIAQGFMTSNDET
jgi:hypothetical protein